MKKMLPNLLFCKFLRNQNSLNLMVRRRKGKIWKCGLKNLRISLPYENLMKIAALQLRGVAKLWWKSHVQIRQRQDQPITWAEFKTAAEKRYCSPHYYMEKKMEYYNFK